MLDEEGAQINLELLVSELPEGSLARRIVAAASSDDATTTPETALRARMNEIRDELQNLEA